VDVCITTQSKKALFVDEEQGNIETGPMRGQQVKWDKEKIVHQKTLEELPVERTSQLS
jgi:hypothetical protein